MKEQNLFITDSIYHLYNRGVAKQPIFTDERDYHRFLLCLAFYQESSPVSDLKTALRFKEFDANLKTEPTKPLLEILAYCLMPNHFHLVVRQLVDGGITLYTKRAMNSYTRGYNTRHRRVGPLYQGIVQSVPVESDQQLLHLTRYVHLNPYAARLSRTVAYQWSSYQAYVEERRSRLCHPEFVLELAGSSERYQEFTQDYADYAQSLATIKHHVAFEYQ